MLFNAPCYGQHATHKLPNTFRHKYGTDIVPCFHACDKYILVNHATLAALHTKIIGHTDMPSFFCLPGLLQN